MRVTAYLILIAAISCQRGSAAKAAQKIGGAGKALAEGAATDLRLTNDSKFAAFLMRAEKPRLDGVPPQMLVGTLHVVPVQGGALRKLGSGVTNLPGGHLFSADSRWVLFLAGYNAAAQTGRLHAFDLHHLEVDPVSLGKSVTFVLPSPDSKRVAFIDGGVLKLGLLPSGPFAELGGEVATAHFSPDNRFLLFKRKLAAGGALLAAAVDKGNTWKLGEGAGDYVISPDSRRLAFAKRAEMGKGTYDLFMADVTLLPSKGSSQSDAPSTKIASGAGSFAFSADGRWLARTEGQKPEAFGNLYLGASDGGASRKIGEKVQDFSFAPDSFAVAYLEQYDVPAQAGVLSVTELPNGKPRRIGGRVPNFTWGADGRVVAFLSRFIKPIYSVDLMLHPLQEDKPFKVNTGVFGYGFSSKNRYLLFRTNCIRNGRACDLHLVELARPHDPPKKIMEGIYGFKVSDDEQRVLATYARVENETFDVAVYNLHTGERRTLDQEILPPAVFAAPDGSRVVYAIANLKRAGVYVADQVP